MAPSGDISVRSVPVMVCALLLAPAAAVLATDIYVPSLPDMAHQFGVGAQTIQSSLSLNLYSFGLAHLVFGPFVDLFGRRRILLFGMQLFVLASLAAALAPNADVLVAARIAQGFAAAAQSVVVIVLIRELFDDVRALRLLGLYGIIVGLMPAIGPMLGGYLHGLYGWPASFLVVGGLGLLSTLGIAAAVPETSQPGGSSRKLRQSVAKYGGVMATRPFLAYAATSGFLFAGLYAFITAAPFALIESRGITPAQYGVYQGMAVTGYLVGAAVIGLVAGRLKPQTLLMAGVGASLCGGSAFVVLDALGVLERIPTLVVPCVGVYVFGLSLTVATVPVLALQAVREAHGQASAVLGTIQVVLGATGAHLVRYFDPASFATLAWPLALAAACAIVTFLLRGDVSGGSRRVEEEGS